MGRFDDGLAEIRAALDMAEINGLTTVVGHVYQRLADLHEHRGDYSKARELFFDAAARCAAHGDAAMREACRACALPALLQSGEWTTAQELADQIVGDGASPAWAKATGVSVGGQILAFRGEFRSASQRLRAALQAVRAIGFRIAEPPTLHLLAVCDWFESKPMLALESARAALRVWAQGEEVHHIVATACGLCSLFAAADDHQGVGDCVGALSVAAEQTGLPEALAGLAYAMGWSRLMAQAPADAVREFTTALEIGDKLELPFARAAAWRGLAEAEARRQATSPAVHHLREAVRLFAGLGAQPFVHEATQRLRSLAPLDLTVADLRLAQAGLTARQLQILREMSRGHSDKEIARTIGLSPRTVEMHVGRVLATLRCRTRLEAVGRAEEIKLLNC